MNSGPYMLTHSGKRFYFLTSGPDAVDIDDIIWHLSLENRFTGATNRAYSVAEHSWRSSFLVPEEYALEALLHDASEAYLKDISSPLKSLLPDYHAIEHRVQTVIASKFGVPSRKSSWVHDADLVMLATEKRDLMPPDPEGEGWTCLDGIKPHPGVLYPMLPWEVRMAFRQRFDHLTQ